MQQKHRNGPKENVSPLQHVAASTKRIDETATASQHTAVPATSHDAQQQQQQHLSTPPSRFDTMLARDQPVSDTSAAMHLEADLAKIRASVKELWRGKTGYLTRRPPWLLDPIPEEAAPMYPAATSRLQLNTAAIDNTSQQQGQQHRQQQLDPSAAALVLSYYEELDRRLQLDQRTGPCQTSTAVPSCATQGF